tara:strand:- start:10530 stop:10829 length:300 start_codon:yes stop_codon:yes gene_type:complete
MATQPHPDRDPDYMESMWGTRGLITDYWTRPMKKPEDQMLREVVGDHIHDMKRQTMLHESIRNDEDYDDWEYGTEPTYGKKPATFDHLAFGDYDGYEKR